VTVQKGFFRNGDPCIKIRVYGVKHEPPGIEVIALIDTGCSGFLHAPMELAIKLGLPLAGTTTVTLADGSRAPSYVAQGAVTFAGTTLAGTVVLSERPTVVLAGMDFLRLFDLTLEINDSTVILRRTRRRGNSGNRGNGKRRTR
jgi:clan AA aspartic protease